MDDQAFAVELNDGRPGARMRGELDIATYGQADAALAPLFGTEGDVELDVSELSFVDSSGIRLFIRLHQSLGEAGNLVLVAPAPHVARVLEIAGLPQLGVRLDGESS
jgi:anti-anti-sigma factor